MIPEQRARIVGKFHSAHQCDCETCRDYVAIETEWLSLRRQCDETVARATQAEQDRSHIAAVVDQAALRAEAAEKERTELIRQLQEVRAALRRIVDILPEQEIALAEDVWGHTNTQLVENAIIRARQALAATQQEERDNE